MFDPSGVYNECISIFGGVSDFSEVNNQQKKSNNRKMTSEKSNIPPKKSNNRKMTSEKSNITPPLSNQINILPYNQP